MAQVMVDKPVKVPPPPPEEPVDMELETPQEEDEDLYTKLKTLQRQLEFYEIQVHFPDVILAERGGCMAFLNTQAMLTRLT